MNKVRRIIAVALASVLAGANITLLAQRRRATPPANRSVSGSESRLTGVYRLDVASSDDPRTVAQRATNELPLGERPRAYEELVSRLEPPYQIAIERRGSTIGIASTRAPLITFNADGREHLEQAADGHTVRTRAVLYGDQLMVSSSGSRDDEFNVNFDPVDNGRRLRITRRIYASQLRQPVIVVGIYNKISSIARWGVYGEPVPPASPTVARNTTRSSPSDNRRNTPPPAPPMIRSRPAQPSPQPERRPDVYVLVIPNGARFVATLNNNLSTAQSREGDRFTLTVREPVQYEGATIEGYVSNVHPAGRITGRSEMALNFESIRLRDGRTAGFAGYIESVRAVGGEDVRVNSESSGNVQEGDSQTDRTVERTAIGAAVGAIIGAIAGGGKGAAIGAIVGAGAGAGSVYAQGRDELELMSGTEMTIRTRRLR